MRGIKIRSAAGMYNTYLHPRCTLRMCYVHIRTYARSMTCIDCREARVTFGSSVGSKADWGRGGLSHRLDCIMHRASID